MKHRLVALPFLAALLTAVPPAAIAAEPAAQESPLPTKVEIVNDHPGTGKPITVGAFAVLHYDAFVYDPAAADHRGRKFDSSRDRGEALSYVYGLKRVVPGMEKGLAGMRVGGSRTIIVPPKLGYDGLKYRNPELPPHSALVFDVELLDVVPQSAPPDQ